RQQSLASKMSSRLERRDDWENLAALCDYRVEELAHVCKVSQRQLQRFFLQHFGKTPKHWLDEMRAGMAVQEIVSGDFLMKAVSNDLKFKDPASFTRFFKRLKGTTPHNFDQKKQMSEKDKKCRKPVGDV
ncbi:MAG TPA: helix-turn-helix transcriptional regulator, partial [Candidatus Binatia bacterium]|nr:helix-turn-helix transcriptional regulator [Candidatus Binatia bacterium]